MLITNHGIIMTAVILVLGHLAGIGLDWRLAYVHETRMNEAWPMYEDPLHEDMLQNGTLTCFDEQRLFGTPRTDVCLQSW